MWITSSLVDAPHENPRTRRKFRILQVDDRYASYASCCARYDSFLSRVFGSAVPVFHKPLVQATQEVGPSYSNSEVGQLVGGPGLTVFTVGDITSRPLLIHYAVRILVEDQSISELSFSLVWQRRAAGTGASNEYSGPRNMNPLIRCYFPPRLSKLCLSWH
ncbi:hypothetical protein P692DRAFT_2079378 [Suillus brevipes Sb2]|nr:hypothetical protein P692DRAFT_2079378 [Suillus brevipes Sb2]